MIDRVLNEKQKMRYKIYIHEFVTKLCPKNIPMSTMLVA